MVLEALFGRWMPRRLEEAFQVLLRKVLRAELDRAAEVHVVGPVRAGRDLIEARFVEVDVRLDPLRGEFAGGRQFLRRSRDGRTAACRRSRRPL